MSVISCRGVTRRYAERGRAPVVAVAAASLEVAAGEFVAVEGPSGSGKTTLLGLIAGLEAPDEGSIVVLGHDLARLTPKERARLRQGQISTVFQSFGLIASLSAGDNVGLPLLLGGVADAERIERVRATLDEVGLGPLEAARIDELSGGERQRVGVARALVIDPAILLADEPTGSLDEGTADLILNLLVAAVRRRGTSLVLVTHDPSSAAWADRQYRMRDGRILNGSLA
jgi:putative ABC transport system ATP-binding protein